MQLPLSVCIIVKNEAEYLPRCLQSVQDLAQEIIVVDTGSTDDTVSLARQFGAKVLETPWEDDFSKARNVSLQAATQPWILVIDADETLGEQAKAELMSLWPHLNSKTVYSFPLYVQGQGNWNYKQYLFANDPALRYSGRVHEQIHPPESYQKAIVDRVQVDHWSLSKGHERVEEKSQYYAMLLQKRLQEEPDDPTPYVFLAWYHLSHDEYPEALAVAKEALAKVGPKSNYRLMAHLYAALAHYHQKDWEACLSHTQTGLALYADYPELHALDGMANLELGRLLPAEASLSQAVYLSRKPTQAGITALSSLRPPAILKELAQVYDSLRQAVPARVCHKLHSAASDSERNDVLANELRGFLERKEWKGAIWLANLFLPVELNEWGHAVLQQIQSPNKLESLLAQADLWSLFQVFGKWPAQLKRLLKDAAISYPLDTRPWERLADMAIRTNHWKEAVEPLERILHLNNQTGWAWNALGVASLMLKDTSKARHCFQMALNVGTTEDRQNAQANLDELKANAISANPSA